MAKKFEIKDGDMSDGYHTFDELYEHRCLLYLNLCLQYVDRCYWRPDFEGWFCLYLESPQGQISYHLPNKLLKYVDGPIERDDKHHYDGHTSPLVLSRLEQLVATSWAESQP